MAAVAPELSIPGTAVAARPDGLGLLGLHHAPLFPVALAATIGLCLDRYLGVPLPLALLVAGMSLLAAWASRARSPRLSMFYLWGGVLALAAAYHHLHRGYFAADDIGRFATDSPRLVRLEGVLTEEPSTPRIRRNDPLVSVPRSETTSAVLEARRFTGPGGGQEVSGLTRLLVPGRLEGMHVGDTIAVTGWLAAPRGPTNPGEWDPAGTLLDQRIRADLRVRQTSDAVALRAVGWPSSFNGWLAVLRGRAESALRGAIPERESGVAVALLLGDNAALARDDWDQYVRTGVVHVLAISGQHLVVLGAFLWWGLRLLHVRQRRGAMAIALFLLLYALLTGGRPAALRAAVLVTVAAGALVLRRTAPPANSFACAWLVVLLLNPTDIFTAGCQLSFLAVAVLVWGIGPYFAERGPVDPLQQLIDASRPWPVRLLRTIGKRLLQAYGVTLAVHLAISPLAAAWQNVVSPAGLLIGPPLVVFTSIALIAGFLLILADLLGGGWLVWPFALVTRAALMACDVCVRWAERLPGSYWYVGEVPIWWLAVFTVGLLATLWLGPLRRRWKWPAVAGLGWLAVGVVAMLPPAPANELRVTYLSVGHGGSAVLETPDGRVLLYDAGSLGGPEVARRQIAPFLWHRHLRRIDEVFVSHADLDHFNGLIALLDRFAVRRVALTPSFADKPASGVQLTMAELHQRGVPVDILHADERLTFGEVTVEVLHPPEHGPPGVENVRSMVLRVRHAGHSFLFTGDLEGPGLERVLALPREPVDIMQAPHHGSAAANPGRLADWAEPRVMVACQGPPRGRVPIEPYHGRGVPYLSTWRCGAITVIGRREGLTIDTFLSRERLELP